MKDHLPQGWIMATLGEVADLASGAGFPMEFQNQKNHPLPFFKVGNLAEVVSSQPLLHSEHTVTEEIARILRARIIPKNAVLFAKIGMAIRLNRRRLLGKPACIDNNMMAAISGKAIEPKYLHRFLETVDLMPLSQATTVPSIRKGDLEDLSVPLPPPNEQRRIVEKLEKLLGKVDACQKRLERIPLILKRFRQSVLAAACSGRLTGDWREQHPEVDADSLHQMLANERRCLWEKRESAKLKANRKNPRDINSQSPYKMPLIPPDDCSLEIPSAWKLLTVSQLAFLDVGFAFKSSEFSDTGIRLLRGENLEPGKLRWNETRYWPEQKLGGCENLLVEEGEIILALDRPLISSGLKLARVKKADLPCLLVQRMMRFKMVESKLTDWLYYNLSIVDFIQHLSSSLTGTDLPHVTGTGVAEYTLGLPSLDEQREIVSRVEALFKTADQIEARYQKAKAHVDKLTQSILAKAFRGELVPQDPNDEPAEVLLERIRREGEKAQQMLH
jgi:type I restriction enzyme S subunit